MAVPQRISRSPWESPKAVEQALGCLTLLKLLCRTLSLLSHSTFFFKFVASQCLDALDQSMKNQEDSGKSVSSRESGKSRNSSKKENLEHLDKSGGGTRLLLEDFGSFWNMLEDVGRALEDVERFGGDRVGMLEGFWNIVQDVGGICEI